MNERSLNREISNIVLNGTKAQRVYACGKSFPHFAMYYFSEYFTYKSADFHWDFFEDCHNLMNPDNSLKEAAWIAFRDSAKSSIAKMLVNWVILYRKRKYINYDSYDKSNSESALFDIAVNLQTNKKVLEDFGQVFFANKQGGKESKIKRISNFITETGIKVEAFSTQEPVRGRIFKNQRPDFTVFDDLENNKTKNSYPTIIKIREHIDEARTGMSPDGVILYLGNYITEDGVIAYILDNLKRRKDASVRFVPVIKDGKTTWKDKYAMTDEEALKRNQDNRKYKVVSLESKRNEIGKSLFEAEMMNNPAKVGDSVFDRGIIDNLEKNCYEYKDIDAGLKIWGEYIPTHRYAIGADVAEGVGRDSSASVVIDFTSMPCRVVATYASNSITPDMFGHELMRQGKMYGKCLLAPESNNSGYATVAVIGEDYSENKIYHHTTRDKTTNEETSKLGWHTNVSTKSSLIYELKTAVEEGQLEIPDIDLMNELKYFQIRDIKSKKVEGMTRHFDTLIACGIAWQMRDTASPDRKPATEQKILKNRAENRNEYV